METVAREPKFLSFLTNIKQSFLPSISRQLPKPEQFVDLRRVPADNNNNVVKKNDEVHENKERKPLLPTRIPPPYSENGFSDSFSDTFTLDFVDEREVEPESVFRRILDNANEGQGQLEPHNRRIDDEEIEQNHNDLTNDSDTGLEFLDDQLAQESFDRFDINSIKPLNTMLTKEDDTIYKQMNFWRNQFESERLSDFIGPEVKPVEAAPEELRKPAKQLQKKRLRLPFMEVEEKINNKKEEEKDKTDDYNGSWNPTDIEEIITEELIELQKTLMVVFNIF